VVRIIQYGTLLERPRNIFICFCTIYYITMKTKFINSFLSKKKQSDKIIIDIRISTITFLNFDLDLSLKKVKLVLVNFGIEFTW
jgi:hypothetical protein